MNGQTNNACLTPNTPTNTNKFEWTCVSWFNKTSDAVTNRSCRFLGVAVASFAAFFTFIPSLAVDLGYASKRLYDRKIKTPPASLQIHIRSTGSEYDGLPDQESLASVYVDHLRQAVWYTAAGSNFPTQPFTSLSPSSEDDHTPVESSKTTSSVT